MMLLGWDMDVTEMIPGSKGDPVVVTDAENRRARNRGGAMKKSTTIDRRRFVTTGALGLAGASLASGRGS